MAGKIGQGTVPDHEHHERHERLEQDEHSTSLFPCKLRFLGVSFKARYVK